MAAPALYPMQLHLHEIRILTLRQGMSRDPVQCSMNTVNLDDHPYYAALSYVWGDSKVQEPIVVNGVTFQATANLAAAMRHIRKTDKGEIIWADAICINQGDLEERTRQVKLMGLLYSYAEKVVIWLGQPDSLTADIVRTIEENTVPSPPDDSNPDTTQLYTEYARQITRLMRIFEEIVARPWWKRVWTVQECILPRSDPVFLCGTHVFRWSKFFAALNQVHSKCAVLQPHKLGIPLSMLETQQKSDTKFEDVASSEENVQHHRAMKEASPVGRDPVSDTEALDVLLAANTLDLARQFVKANTNLSLYASMAPCFGRQASVPHDYVYGFLGLASEEERGAVDVDYTKPAWHVYRDFMDRLLSNASPEDMQFLTIISFLKQTDHDQPSWIPDFTAQRNVNKYTGTFLASPTCFQTLEEVWWSDDGDILMLQGVFLDVIDTVHLMSDDQARLNGWQQKLYELVKLSRPTAVTETDYPPPAVVSSSLEVHSYEIFTANTLSANLLNLGKPRLGHCWDLMTDHGQQSVLTLGTKSGQATLQDEPDFSLELLAHSHVACKGRKLISTKSGIRGIAVPNVEVGDVIVCFYGFHMPFVLRPKHDHYTIVGGVNLAGLMDWMVLSDCLDQGLLREATFRLR